MSLIQIKPYHFMPKINQLWANEWLLLTSGDFAAGHYNTMTVGWGSLGVMWGKPFAQVVVRHSRYTYEFMNQYDSFTLTAFPSKYKKALKLLGSKSGRDSDKIAESGLTPIKAQVVAAPSFAEATLSIECKKTYWQDMEPANFLDPEINTHYPNHDYHCIYFGDVVHIAGIEKYSVKVL